jgi:hypothetical protein
LLGNTMVPTLRTCEIVKNTMIPTLPTCEIDRKHHGYNVAHLWDC